jgi:hypothetical protein
MGQPDAAILSSPSNTDYRAKQMSIAGVLSRLALTSQLPGRRPDSERGGEVDRWKTHTDHRCSFADFINPPAKTPTALVLAGTVSLPGLDFRPG